MGGLHKTNLKKDYTKKIIPISCYSLLFFFRHTNPMGPNRGWKKISLAPLFRLRISAVIVLGCKESNKDGCRMVAWGSLSGSTCFQICFRNLLTYWLLFLWQILGMVITFYMIILELQEVYTSKKKFRVRDRRCFYSSLWLCLEYVEVRVTVSQWSLSHSLPPNRTFALCLHPDAAAIFVRFPVYASKIIVLTLNALKRTRLFPPIQPQFGNMDLYWRQNKVAVPWKGLYCFCPKGQYSEVRFQFLPLHCLTLEFSLPASCFPIHL